MEVIENLIRQKLCHDIGCFYLLIFSNQKRL